MGFGLDEGNGWLTSLSIAACWWFIGHRYSFSNREELRYWAITNGLRTKNRHSVIRLVVSHL